MPKISAPSVAEHREHIQTQLVDAAEELLRRGEPLTASAVSQAAGIARNSIYRYVYSIDDLHGMVLARYLPAWDTAVRAALASYSDPGEQIVAWVRVNLEQAVGTGHGWLMDVSRSSRVSVHNAAVAHHAHRILRKVLNKPWARLSADPSDAQRWTWLTVGLLQAALSHLDEAEEADRHPLIEQTCLAASALVEAARARTNS